MKPSVIFNIPNSLGYLRICLLILSTFASGSTFVVLYGLSSSLDFFDGHFARMLNQCSLLGSCLDMITDLTSRVVILLRIVQRRSECLQLLTIYMVFDLISHFTYFHMAALVGRHHKRTDNRFLRIYYDKRVLGPICLLSEMFFMYMYHSSSRGPLLYVLASITVVKTGFHLIQLVEAISGISNIHYCTKHDVQEVD
ncbi:CDP-diacylglycerolinsitol-3-phosphatidyltransfer ase-like protein [Encephalitozoon cuniculi EcunIII-L]|uniref:CDP-diacylglycerol inositol-3-phosphatidyltransferase n=1 Tax=Encephalitozoon cuniculi TaxID=6035 RepID=M1K9U2_ENCCN|nr:CDP-diacylglycerol inositol-3-phosphatidyltransferase [Encephalitozoon cuniculi]KMV66754.1 CDP-diacylglycerolinsitol-3-phosphatidyltransfer ase-like protein [Encephalitozoon cuniculi EcunIII-L]UYI28471.1 CDP-alcohol phosphatidyltransferase [Encephalitozoon cuniculi]